MSDIRVQKRPPVKTVTDPIVKDLIAKIKKEDDGAIIMVAALMPYEHAADHIVTFWNEERKFYEFLGGKIDNEDLHSKDALGREFIEEIIDEAMDKETLDRLNQERRDSYFKGQLDLQFHNKLGISPTLIGNLFGRYIINDIKRVGDKVKITKRLFYAFYINDYGELPEKTMDPKYTKTGILKIKDCIHRNDISPLVLSVCEDIIIRSKGKYKF